jgi:hypothetical protein
MPRIKTIGLALAVALVLTAIVTGTASAGAVAGSVLTSRLQAQAQSQSSSGSLTCAGTSEDPGVLAGVYNGNVSVEGVCDVSAGAARVVGNLTLLPGSALVAIYGHSEQEGMGEPSLTVSDDLLVEKGASALLGCEPGGLRCLNAPEQFGSVRVESSLKEKKPLGVVMHNSVVLGSITEKGGGGGSKCEYPGIGIFGAIGFPVYSDYEDGTVGGSFKVDGLKSCWLGINRLNVGGSMSVDNDKLADPSAATILSNTITGNLACKKDSHVWDSSEITGELWPREPEPNTVDGQRSGECVLASPATEDGEPGPGPF